jgi:HlyD family secretion protein
VRGIGKLAAAGAVVAAAAIGGWLAWSKDGKEAPRYLTAAVDRGTVTQVVGTTGTLTAVTTVKVGSQVSGIIATLHADFNDRVTQGQVLATLDPTPFEAAVNENKAQVQRARVAALDAEAKYRRQKALFAAELSSQDQLDSAKAAYDQAEAQVEELRASLQRAETSLKYSVIRSPIDGVVVSRDYDVGQTVAASFQAPTLFTIAEDLTHMQLTCDVDEADIGQVKVAQPVAFSVDTFPEKEFSGRVAQIRLAPTVTNNVVTYPVIVDVENRDLALLPGMTAEVRIEVAQAHDVLRVPSSALRFRPEMLGLAVERLQRGGGGDARGGRSAVGTGRPNPAGEPARTGVETAQVYLAGATPETPLRPATFMPGLTDGRYVQVKTGDVHQGDLVVVGVATALGEEIGGIAGMTPFGRRRGR